MNKGNDAFANHCVVHYYVEKVLSGEKIACTELLQSCQRFKKDLDNPIYDFDPTDAEFVIKIIENTFCHQQGERLDATSLRGTPFLLEPFHKFIIYNLLGFFEVGTIKRRFHEAFIFIPRKNIKTSFSSALAFAIGMLQRKSCSKIYIVGAALKQTMESFNFLKYNMERIGLNDDDSWRIIDNNQEHSISGQFDDGALYIQALAANPNSQDSLNCNLGIADEIHAYKTPKQYNIIKEAMKAYTNKLMIGISTAGDNMSSFCYRRLKYCQKVLNGTFKDEQLFVFICKAPEDENGEVDFMSPIVHEMANPAYGVSIRPNEMLEESIQAQNDPQQRKDFFAKSLNIFTAALKAYFNINTFRKSDEQYDWTIEELAKLPITWFGGADLSKLHDLTAACLYGTYFGYKRKDGKIVDVDIIVSHCWFPITAAARKADEDSIPLFGWKDDGWLTMSNNPTVNHAEIVNWFIMMRSMGFKIKEVGHDRKFCREYFIGMKKAKFKIVDQPQYFYRKSEGFRRIEVKQLNGELYYLHSQAFEYCVQNVRAIEKTDDMIEFDKVEKETRIDIFDASVFGCVRMLENLEGKKLDGWFMKGGEKNNE